MLATITRSGGLTSTCWHPGGSSGDDTDRPAAHRAPRRGSYPGGGAGAARRAVGEPGTDLPGAARRAADVPVRPRAAARGTRQGLAVWAVHYRYRGWNGRQASPLADVGWALAEVRRRHGDVPVVLLGHSMGGRAALRRPGDPSVRAVLALAPWLPDGASRAAGRPAGLDRPWQQGQGHLTPGVARVRGAGPRGHRTGQLAGGARRHPRHAGALPHLAAPGGAVHAGLPGAPCGVAGRATPRCRRQADAAKPDRNEPLRAPLRIPASGHATRLARDPLGGNWWPKQYEVGCPVRGEQAWRCCGVLGVALAVASGTAFASSGSSSASMQHGRYVVQFVEQAASERPRAGTTAGR